MEGHLPEDCTMSPMELMVYRSFCKGGAPRFPRSHGRETMVEKGGGGGGSGMTRALQAVVLDAKAKGPPCKGRRNDRPHASREVCDGRNHPSKNASFGSKVIEGKA